MAAVTITVPGVGESINEGILSRWLKADGDAVKAGEPLFELETDKASNVVPAATSGVLKIEVPEGTTVDIGAAVGSIDPSGQPQAGRAAGRRPRRARPRLAAADRPGGVAGRPVARRATHGRRGEGRSGDDRGDRPGGPDHQGGRRRPPGDPDERRSRPRRPGRRRLRTGRVRGDRHPPRPLPPRRQRPRAGRCRARRGSG